MMPFKEDIYTINGAESYIALSKPGDDESQDDWDDEDDEVFEDFANDRNDYHLVEEEDEFIDPDDDDHLPDDDLQ